MRSRHPYPLSALLLPHSAARRQGGGGYAINLSGEAATLKIKGAKHLKIYRAKVKNPEDRRASRSTGQRHFCKECGSALWLFDPTWKDLVHPFASAIDTKPPVPPEHTHPMLDSAGLGQLQVAPRDKTFKRVSQSINCRMA